MSFTRVGLAAALLSLGISACGGSSDSGGQGGSAGGGAAGAPSTGGVGATSGTGGVPSTGGAGGTAAAGGTAGTGGGGAGTGGQGGTHPQATALCDGMFDPMLKRLKEICSAADQQAKEYTWLAGFAASFKTDCVSLLSSGLNDGRITIDGTALAACLNKVTTLLSAASTYDEIMALDEPPECDALVTGKQGVGQKCRQPYECLTGLACVGYTSSVEGTCAAPTLGQACGTGQDSALIVTFNFGDHPECASGLYCDAHQCEATVPAGAQCWSDDECATSLECVAGTCKASKSVAGGACYSDNDCQDGLYCETKLCAPLKKTGQVCTAGDCEGRCDEAQTPAVCVAFCGQG